MKREEGDAHLQLSSAILTAHPKDIFFCTAGTGQNSRETERHSYSDGNKQIKAVEGFILTLKAPRRNSVGCSPTENINRRIVEAIKARMPWGLGRAMTMAREMSMAVHSSPDQCGSRVPATRRQGSQRSGLSPHRGDTPERVQ